MTSEPRAVLFDFGGVLTTSVGASFRAFEREEGLPKGTVFSMIAQAYTAADDDHPIARLERGDASVEEFEELLIAEFSRAGHSVRPGRLLPRLFALYEPLPEMWAVVEACRRAGARTALLSNSWGPEGYPEDLIEQHFDARVISHEVGLRKPDAAIFELTADEVGVAPERCAFVDDAQPNVEAAQALGMTGVLHRSTGETVARLSAFLGADLLA